jgi:hypothetical protein
MAERLSKQQKYLFDCVKDLIDLYEQEWRDGRVEGSWESDSVALLKNLLQKVFGHCDYDPATMKFKIHPVGHDGKGKINQGKPHKLWVDEEDRMSFIQVMSNIDQSVIANKFLHFYLVGLIESLDVHIPSNHLFWTSRGRHHVHAMNPELRSCLTRVMLEKHAILAFQGKIKDKESVQPMEIVQSNLGVYRVMTCSNCGNEILGEGESRTPVLKEVSAISSVEPSSFAEIVRSILVDFHLEFGGYHRIKSCEHCEKLFLEKKRDYGAYCSNTCRWKANQSKEPKERSNCRRNQNKWLGYQLGNPKIAKVEGNADFFEPKGLRKADCKDCFNHVKGGQCMVLRDKNHDIIEVLDAPL